MNFTQQTRSLVSFGIVADLQYCDAPPFKNRFFRNSTHKLKSAIAEFNKNDLDFVINLGDLIDRDWASFNEILPFFAQLNTPVHHVLGNHDYEVEPQYKKRIHKKLGIDKYYDFSIENWRFIILDGNELSTFANLEDSDAYRKAETLRIEMELKQKVNANFWNGGIGLQQKQWLEEKLENATVNREHVVVFCHYPVYPENRHNLLNDVEILEIIGQYDCVKLWFNGHNHHGNYGVYHNTHFVNLRGMVETEYDVAFSIVQLTEDSIKINGFGTEISAKLNF